MAASRVSGKIIVKRKFPQTGIQASGNEIQMWLKKTLEITEKLIWVQKERKSANMCFASHICIDVQQQGGWQ